MTSVALPLRGSLRRPLVWAGRALLYLALAIVVLRGVMAIVSPAASRDASAAPAASAFPAEQASAFAREFALTYLSYDASSTGAWQDAVAPFSPGGPTGNQLGGWDGQGSEQAVAAESWSVHPTSSSAGDIKVGVLVAPKAGAEHWVYLEVPVLAQGGGFAVPTAPVFVGGPARAALPSAPTFRTDQDLSSQLQGMVGAFFQAYATSDSAALGYFLAPGARVAPLGGALHFDSLAGLSVQASSGGATNAATHLAVASVAWRDPAGGAELTQDYRLSLTETGGRWYVASIGALDPSLLGATSM